MENLFKWPVVSAESSCFNSCSLPRGGVREDGSSVATSTVSKNHSLAEKRRRDRINVQLDLLKNLVPRSDKMDKAALLTSVVEQVKDLKKKAKEVSKVLTVPSDFDQVNIDCFLNQDQISTINAKTADNIFISVCICCDDRPDLFSELTQVFNNLNLMIVSADMGCLGGRIRCVLVLRVENGKIGVCISNTIHSLKVMLNRVASFPTGSDLNHSRSKRQRFFSTGR